MKEIQFIQDFQKCYYNGREYYLIGRDKDNTQIAILSPDDFDIIWIEEDAISFEKQIKIVFDDETFYITKEQAIKFKQKITGGVLI